MFNLQEHYNKVVVPELKKEFGYTNVHQIPKILSIHLNMGVGAQAVADSKTINHAYDQLTLIAGQKPVKTKSRKSIAAFKLREGMEIGCKVTLRKQRMFDFMERLVFIALPRVRDFRGLSKKSFDGRGNFSLGIKEQIVFPEIDYDKIDRVRGMDIVITTSAKTNEEAAALLKAMCLPLI